jgi:hypothetical protein
VGAIQKKRAPAVPPVYRPGSAAGAIQNKPAPAVPPVYHPRSAGGPIQNKPAPAVPPVYRPAAALPSVRRSAIVLRHRGPIGGSSAIDGARYLRYPVYGARLTGRDSVASHRTGPIQRHSIANAQVAGLTHVRGATPMPGAVQPSAPSPMSPPRAFDRSPAAPTRFQRLTATIQAALHVASKVHGADFDSGPEWWAADSTHCTLCGNEMGKWHRHHCRVCGNSVCDDCSAQKFLVRFPQTSSGKASRISEERVCAGCALARKITIARAKSRQFSDLITQAGDPKVVWAPGCRPGYSPGRITLNPKRGDVFATYIFELTNAAAKQTPLPRPAAFDTAKEYGFQIEHQEYTGNIWADDVAAEINRNQKDFQVARYYRGSRPNRETFSVHLDEMQKSGHTQLYYEQWQKDKKKMDLEIERKKPEILEESFSEAMMYGWGWSSPELTRRARAAVGGDPTSTGGVAAPRKPYYDDYFG